MTTKEGMEKERAALDEIEAISFEAQFETWNGGNKSALSRIFGAVHDLSFGAQMNLQEIRDRRFACALKRLKQGLKMLKDD